jgi:Domain of unknown function (DUF4157)
MKTRAFASKTHRKNGVGPSLHSSAGPNGVALAPPAYGIEFIDRSATQEPSPNRTGMPDSLKSGIEALSGMDMSDVRVHADSHKPGQFEALAYAQGNDIHLAPGQKHNLPHEVWHVVQQRQGRVQPTMQIAGMQVSDDPHLEREADVMGARAMQNTGGERPATLQRAAGALRGSHLPLQRTNVNVAAGEFEDQTYTANNGFDKGADFVIRFVPRADLGNDGDTISLVQTVKDTTKLVNPNTGANVTPVATTSLLHTRKLSSTDAGVSAAERGTGIDQEVLDDNADAAEKRVVNLDPRYTEKRMDASGALNTAGRTRHPYSVRSAIKSSSGWTNAVLNDAPAVSTRFKPSGSQVQVQHTLTGGMDFEVTALHNNTGNYLGSAKWGWRMNGPTVVLNPTALTLGDAAEASDTFMKAAKKWNETPIVDPKTGTSHTPMQLPIGKAFTKRAKIEQLDRRWDDRLMAVPESKAAEWEFGESMTIWIARKEEGAVIEWAESYLNFLDQKILAEAKAIDTRWKAINGTLGDLSRTQTFVALQHTAAQKYEQWKLLYEAAKLGAAMPEASAFLEQPNAYLDGIEAAHKGKPASRWSEEALRWRSRTGLGWV